jgi:hypothetical protein
MKNQDFLHGIQKFERLEIRSEKRYTRSILHIFLDEEICFECEQCWTMIIAGKSGVQAQFLEYIYMAYNCLQRQSIKYKHNCLFKRCILK